MKKLTICGCSFSAISNKEQYKNTHFSEILAKKINYDLRNFARAGASNGAIRIQIDQAIQENSDLVIIFPTSYDRIEIPNSFNKDENLFNKVGKIFSDLFFSPSVYGIKEDDCSHYNPNLGIKNFNYSIADDSRLLVDQISSFLNDYGTYCRKEVPEPIKDTIKNYSLYMYDPYWKKQQDKWILRDGLLELQRKNINFLVGLGSTLFYDINEMKNFLIGAIDEKYIITDPTVNTWYTYLNFPPEGRTKETVYGIKDPGYHSTPEGQIYLANCLYNYIKDRFYVDNN